MVSRTTRYQKVSRIAKKKMSTTNHNLIIGNCLDALADKKILKNESVDLIVTSPPYGLEKKLAGPQRLRLYTCKKVCVLQIAPGTIYDLTT